MKCHQAVEVGGSVRVKLNTGEELPLSTEAKRERGDLCVMLTQTLFFMFLLTTGSYTSSDQ